MIKAELNALLVIGSDTAERALGLLAGQRVGAALRRRGWHVEEHDAAARSALVRRLVSGEPPDLVVPVGYGAGIEDGAVYTIAEFANVPCAGPTPAAGALGVNKHLFVMVVRGLFPAASKVLTPRSALVSPGATRRDPPELLEGLNLPLIVKPNSGGSSIGLTVADTHDAAIVAARTLNDSGEAALVQEFVAPAREFSVAVLDRPEGPRALPVVELRREQVMGYEEKFGDGARGRHLVPAPLDRTTAARLSDVAMVLHAALGQRGLARYDLLLKDDTVFILEVNPIAGMLEASIAVDAAAAAGIPFDELAETYSRSAFLRRDRPDARANGHLQRFAP